LASLYDVCTPALRNEIPNGERVKNQTGFFGPLLFLLLGLLSAFPVVPLAVSLTMDGGFLRVLLFGVGWLFSVFYGLIVGGLIVEGLLRLEFLAEPIVQTFMWGSPMAAWWGHQRLQSMPREQRQAWTQTLTGGALLGFGAGSVAGLLRSAASAGSGFGGFGGGSFGGGGASGSWGGTSGLTGKTSGAAGTVAGPLGTTGSATSAAAGAVVAGGMADKAASSLSTNAALPDGLWTRLSRWFQKFQWYHGFSFVLTAIVFLPLGLGTMKALQNTDILLFVLGWGALYGAYNLIIRPTRATSPQSSTSFTGGAASSSWMCPPYIPVPISPMRAQAQPCIRQSGKGRDQIYHAAVLGSGRFLPFGLPWRALRSK